MDFDHTNNTIAITDALSLTGPAIIRELLLNDYKIKALVKTASNLPEEWLSHPRLRLIRGDIWDPLSLENLMKGASAAIHTAQFFSLRKKDKKRMQSVQIEGTAQVVNSALKNNVPKLVHLSSTEALGHGNQIDGDGPRLKWLDDEDYSLFGRTAFHAELQAWRGQAEGLSVVILRPSFLINAHRDSNPIADWLEQVITG
ncbi:MAG: NAD-dependent epimerase/dehydratase family protein, partial [Bacteroidetes bacterium]|nr:NAD-dependent epimerase/dehydratase family protein [Bacteroidota bacterium]